MMSLLLEGGLCMSEKGLCWLSQALAFSLVKKKTLTFFFFLLNNNNIGPVKGLKSRQKKSGLRKRRKKKRRQKGGKTTRTCSKTVSNQILAHAQEELMLRRLTLD